MPAMTRINNSSTNDSASGSTDGRATNAKMIWSYSWEFDWLPATAAADSLRDSTEHSGADELSHMLEKALAYAG
jgi:hypothetical protein